MLEMVPEPIMTVAPAGRLERFIDVYVPLGTGVPFTVVVCVPFTVF
jgi:hypothetical protein